MADTGLHLIEVTVRPCDYVNDVISGSWTNLQAWSKAGNGRVVHGYKVGVLRYFKTRNTLL